MVKYWNKMRMPIFATFIDYCTRDSSQGNQGRIINKIYPYWKERYKTVFTDDIILHIGSPKEHTKRHLELRNVFNKIGGYKITIQKSYFYTLTMSTMK